MLGSNDCFKLQKICLTFLKGVGSGVGVQI